MRSLLWKVLVLFFMFPVTAFASSGEGEIFFEKKVYTDSVGGKRSIYETHVVAKGDTVWKLLGGNNLTQRQYAERLKNFKRANPQVKDPSHLMPGQKIVIPVGPPTEVARGDKSKTAPYHVRKGDSLSKIYAAMGSPGGSRKEFMRAVQAINPSVKDINLIYAGSTLHLPGDEYFGRSARTPSVKKDDEPVIVSRHALSDSSEETDEPVIISRHSLSYSPGERASARPQAELLPGDADVPDSSFVMTRKEESDQKQMVVPPASSAYKGLLSDIFNALGEKWVEKGTMFLPLSSGEEVILDLSDFPMVKFHGDRSALIDFQGGLPSRVLEEIRLNWDYVQVVSLQDARGATDRIDRILQAADYHSVREGISSPMTIGESVVVTLPARWAIQKTQESALSGDLVLIKETPEKPSAELVSVLRFAQRVGVSVLPFADDPAANEGFLIGIEDEKGSPKIPVAFVVPSDGPLAALDFSLSFLGIVFVEEEIQVG
ncbi:MAG: LysM peptidoglycan-binding domain-containing protein, partial [Syntrophorhabdaceae bacterium]|nr:LysM peptidoglycan-binding domain-containing protein [Syntrophorhabdaceae bacterium]